MVIKFLIFLILLLNILYSHPHLFIDVILTLKSDRVVNVKWIIDRENSKILFKDYDLNSNGEFEEEEIEEFKKFAYENTLKKRNFYTKVNLKNLNLNNFQNLNIEREADNFIILFDIVFLDKMEGKSIKFEDSEDNLLGFEIIKVNSDLKYKVNLNSINF